MHKACLTLGLGALLLATGCENSKWAIFRNREHAPIPTDNPSAAHLVGYLNGNAQQIRSLECLSLNMDITHGIQQFNVPGRMICQKPRNFRMVAEMVGAREADIGSNDQEFWFWLKRNNPPYLMHCSYRDLEKGGVDLPFPVQPEWVMETLGMAEYGSPQDYQVVPKQRTVELVRDVTSQGQRLRKVTVFNREPARFQVIGHALLNSRAMMVCSAKIEDAQAIGGAIVPRVILLDYPAEKLKLKMILYRSPSEVALNKAIDAAQTAALFTRPTLTGVRSYDLALRVDDTNSPIQPAGAFLPQR